MYINLQQITHVGFLNILNVLKLSHSQDCKLGIKGKDTNIQKDFAGSVEVVHENKDFRIFINDLLLL